MIVFLLIVIAIGVLLISEPGKKLLAGLTGLAFFVGVVFVILSAGFFLFGTETGQNILGLFIGILFIAGVPWAFKEFWKNHRKSKVLFVDDDKAIVSMLSKKFQESGYNTEILFDADGDFVDKVYKIKPDLISLDIVMPGRDGFEAIKLLKDDSRTKHIPVVFLTNLYQKIDIQKGLDLGAEDYLITAQNTPEEIIRKYKILLKRN